MLGLGNANAEEAELGGVSEQASEPVLNWNVTGAHTVTLVDLSFQAWVVG